MSYFPSFLEPRRMAEKALGMSGISKSQVRRLCSEVDEKVASMARRAYVRIVRFLAERRNTAEQLDPLQRWIAS